MSLAQPKERNTNRGVTVWQRLRSIPLTWQRAGFIAVLGLSAFLNFYRLDQNGYTNEYYAAAVKSMLTSWHNFFFNAYDPGGFITLDKPPVAFWFETVSAWIFGYNGVSLLIPSALAGIANVALVYYLIKRVFGPIAGLFAAFALAITPIFVVMDRHNNPESLLILSLILAAWAMTFAVEKGKPVWLMVAVAMVGVGFNIKMLEAFIILPALYLVYFLLAPQKWWKRIMHLALATGVLVAVSLSWAAVVDLTPANQRPYVGGSATNSVFNLILDYNGLGRIDGNTMGGGGGGNPPAGFQPGTSTGQPPANFQLPGATDGNARDGGQNRDGGGGRNGIFAGQAGPFRMFDPQLAGETGWLLPLALLGLVVAAGQSWRRFSGTERKRRLQAFIIWGGWLLTFMAVFSDAKGIFHNYYLVMLAPAIAALAGVGLEALWHSYKKGGWQSWLLPSVLLVTAVFQLNILGNYSDWNRTMALVIIGLELVCAGALLAIPSLFKRADSRWTIGVATVAFLGLLIAPFAWAIHAVTSETFTNATLPTAVPAGGSNTTNNLWVSLMANWNSWLSGLVILLGAVIVIMLVMRFVARQFKGRKQLTNLLTGFSVAVVISLGLSLALTALPPAASASSNASLPSTGIIGNPSMALSGTDKLIAYLEANQNGYTYLVATTSSMNASPLIIKTGEPVMAMGGFSGSDKVLTNQQLTELVKNKTVRYFLLDSSGMGGQQASSWVTQNCKAVDSQLWSTSGSSASSGGFGRGGGTLYDCAGVS